MTTTQINIVRNHLKKGKSITSLQAFKITIQYDSPIIRLSAIIHKLRIEGMKIKTVWEVNKKGKRFAKYML